MIDKVIEKAYAKLNISLDIVGKLPDGYHAMDMVFQSVSLCDDVVIRKTETEGISLSSNLDYLPCNSSNIAYRAAEMFFQKAGISDYGIEIALHKRIPVCAGMGGGSSDGAAVLRALNRMYGFLLSECDMLTISEKLGSDVPFCLRGGTAHATGKGEILQDLKPLPDCHIVICKPVFSFSTPELFRMINVKKIRLRPDTSQILTSIENEDIRGVARHMYNVFEDAIPKGRDTVNDIKAILCECSALGAVMTGSGSAVFGIFDDKQFADSSISKLSEKYTSVFYAQPIEKLNLHE